MQYKLKCQAFFSMLHICRQVIFVRTDSNLCRKGLTVHWSAPNSLIRSYLQPCTNSMWGDESEAVASIISNYPIIPDCGCPKGGSFLSRSSHNSPETYGRRIWRSSFVYIKNPYTWQTILYVETKWYCTNTIITYKVYIGIRRNWAHGNALLRLNHFVYLHCTSSSWNSKCLRENYNVLNTPTRLNLNTSSHRAGVFEETWEHCAFKPVL